MKLPKELDDPNAPGFYQVIQMDEAKPGMMWASEVWASETIPGATGTEQCRMMLDILHRQYPGNIYVWRYCYRDRPPRPIVWG